MEAAKKKIGCLATRALRSPPPLSLVTKFFFMLNHVIQDLVCRIPVNRKINHVQCRPHIQQGNKEMRSRRFFFIICRDIQNTYESKT